MSTITKPTEITQFPVFRSHPLIRGGHAQTLFGAYIPQSPLRSQTIRHRLKLDDGDFTLLHDDCPAFWMSGKRVILMVPGMGGSFESPYMLRIAAKLNDLGFRTFRMDHRGFGPGYHLAKRPGHAGRSEDTAKAAVEISRRCPNSRITAVGFSMGGNMVLKMLGEYGRHPPGNLDSGIAIAPPIDILPCSLNMLRLPNQFYGRGLTRQLLRQVARHRPILDELARIPTYPVPKTLIEFDDRFTAPLGGFCDARDYYAKCSSVSLLPSIRIQSLIIAAADDPIVPVSIYANTKLAPCTQIVITQGGGHVGFLGVPGIDPDCRWLDWRIIDWLSSLDESSRSRNDRAESRRFSSRPRTLATDKDHNDGSFKRSHRADSRKSGFIS